MSLLDLVNKDIWRFWIGVITFSLYRITNVLMYPMFVFITIVLISIKNSVYDLKHLNIDFIQL